MDHTRTDTFSVRWVYQRYAIKGSSGRVHMDGGQKPALCYRGRKHALCIAAGYPVRVLKRDVDSLDGYRLAMVQATGPAPTGKGADGQHEYPLDQAITTLRALGLKNGITAGASKLLDRAAAWSGQRSTTIDEDDFTDEEEIAMEQVAEQVVGPTTDATPDAKPANKKPAKPAKESTVKAKRTSKRSATKRTAKRPTKRASKGNGAARTKGSKRPTVETGEFRPGSAVAKGHGIYLSAVKALKGKDPERGWRRDLADKIAKQCKVAPSSANNFVQVYSRLPQK